MTMVRYGRITESALGFMNAADMHKKAINFDSRDIGKLRIYGCETLRHFMAKSILMYELLKMNHRVVCEAELCGVGRMDVFDLDTNVNYELESEPSISASIKKKDKYRQAGVDLVIIQIRDWNDSMGYLAEYIKQWIRPD